MSCPICSLPPGNDHRRCFFAGYEAGLWKSDKEWSDACDRLAAAKAAAVTTPAAWRAPVATEPATAASALRKCGICRQPGHTRAKCTQQQVPASAPAEAPAPWRKLEGRRYTFPPGRYYLGDICYPLGELPLYDEVWGKQFGYNEGVYTNGTHTFAVFHTAYGDGGYEGSDGVEYGVDAGVIGFVPTALFDEKDFKRRYLGMDECIHNYAHPVTFEADSGTFMVHGKDRHITIHTAGDEEEDF